MKRVKGKDFVGDGLLEATVREVFRERWTGWLSRHEPGSGAGIGYPDTSIMVPGGRIVPIELKRGSLDNSRLYPSAIRPAQFSWHRSFIAAGGKALFIVGVPDAKEKAALYAVSAARVLVDSNCGIKVDNHCCVLLPIRARKSGGCPAFSQALISFIE